MSESSVWNEVLSILQQVFTRPRGKVEVGTPTILKPGPLHENYLEGDPSMPMMSKSPDVVDWARKHYSDEAERLLSEPGAQILDTPIAPRLTPQEEAILERAYSEQGRTYRPANRIFEGDLPKGTLKTYTE